MGDRQLAFGRAEPVVGVPRRERLDDRLRIGEADVFDRRSGQPAQDVDRVLAARQHARQPIERGIGVGAAQRLVQSTDQIVVTLLGLVVERRPVLHDACKLRRPERVAPRQPRNLLDEVKEKTAVAIGHCPQCSTAVLGQGQVMTEGFFGTADQDLEVVVIETSEHEYLDARQQCADQLERRVLGRRPDEDHRAVLDIREEGVLLGAVETVDLVDKQQGALAHRAALLGGFEYLAQIGDTRKDGRERLEDEVGALCQEPRDRRLAAARRTPQDHRGELSARHHPLDRPLGAQQMILPDDVGEPARPQPVGQRVRCLTVKQCAHLAPSPPSPASGGGWGQASTLL